jgi:hypothetical protein
MPINAAPSGWIFEFRADDRQTGECATGGFRVILWVLGAGYLNPSMSCSGAWDSIVSDKKLASTGRSTLQPAGKPALLFHISCVGECRWTTKVQIPLDR